MLELEPSYFPRGRSSDTAQVENHPPAWTVGHRTRLFLISPFPFPLHTTSLIIECKPTGERVLSSRKEKGF